MSPLANSLEHRHLLWSGHIRPGGIFSPTPQVKAAMLSDCVALRGYGRSGACCPAANWSSSYRP